MRSGAGEFPRTAQEVIELLPAEKALISGLSRKDAVLIRQLRTGETRGAGMFFRRLLDDDVAHHCRWCRRRDEETISHLFGQCTNIQVTALRMSTVGAADDAQAIDMLTLYRDPPRALRFYRACLDLLT